MAINLLPDTDWAISISFPVAEDVGNVVQVLGVVKGGITSPSEGGGSASGTCNEVRGRE